MIDTLRSLAPSVLLLRLVVLVAPVSALVATAVQGPGPRPLLVLLVVVCSIGGAVRPESSLLTVGLALVLGWWALAARHDIPATVVPAAWLVLLAHLAATVASYGPQELAVSGGVARRWAARATALAIAPPALWLLAVLVSGRPEPAGVWLVGLAVAGTGAVAAGVAIRSVEP